MTENKQMSLGLFIQELGHHFTAWRHPSVQKEQVLSFKHIKNLALKAENAKFDAVFIADWLAVGDITDTFEQSAHLQLEPFTLLSGLAAVTDKIGLIGTVSTTYNEPFNVARKFASLDHISEGRAGWNIVTSTGVDTANNYGFEEELSHSTRYERSEEFVDVSKKLWDSWEDGSVIFDQATSRYVDAEKVHPINFEGKWFNVKGPLNISRPLQGYPVLVQAGSSDVGRELAAKTAEVVFTASQTLEEGQAFYKDVKDRLAKYGRIADELKIMPGVYPIVASTVEEAEAKRQLMLDLIPEKLGVAKLSDNFGFDLSGYDIDGPLPDLPSVDEINGIKSRFQLIKDLADRENLTIRQLYQRIAGARGHREIIGTPEQIADQLQEWFENGAADGFNIMPPILPNGLDDFVNLVVPILQERGIYRTEYTGSTLREHLQLKRPTNQFEVELVK